MCDTERLLFLWYSILLPPPPFPFPLQVTLAGGPPSACDIRSVCACKSGMRLAPASAEAAISSPGHGVKWCPVQESRGSQAIRTLGLLPPSPARHQGGSSCSRFSEGCNQFASAARSLLGRSNTGFTRGPSTKIFNRLPRGAIQGTKFRIWCFFLSWTVGA